MNMNEPLQTLNIAIPDGYQLVRANGVPVQAFDPFSDTDVLLYSLDATLTKNENVTIPQFGVVTHIDGVSFMTIPEFGELQQAIKWAEPEINDAYKCTKKKSEYLTKAPRRIRRGFIENALEPSGRIVLPNDSYNLILSGDGKPVSYYRPLHMTDVVLVEFSGSPSHSGRIVTEHSIDRLGLGVELRTPAEFLRDQLELTQYASAAGEAMLRLGPQTDVPVYVRKSIDKMVADMEKNAHLRPSKEEVLAKYGHLIEQWVDGWRKERAKKQ